eukprot:COSAG02_NODE_8665_length_2486_cov_4.066611_4_plen_105_part_00
MSTEWRKAPRIGSSRGRQGFDVHRSVPLALMHNNGCALVMTRAPAFHNYGLHSMARGETVLKKTISPRNTGHIGALFYVSAQRVGDRLHTPYSTITVVAAGQKA